MGWGFKGTASVDPRGYPLLYAGQGLNDTNGTIGPWRYRVFDLIQNKEVWHISGLDAAAPRHDWGAFDSSALINARTDTLIQPAENGLIYKVKLNASYDAARPRRSRSTRRSPGCATPPPATRSTASRTRRSPTAT